MPVLSVCCLCQSCPSPVTGTLHRFQPQLQRWWFKRWLFFCWDTAGRVKISSLHSFSQPYCWRTRSEASEQFSVFRLELWEVLVQVHWDLPTGSNHRPPQDSNPSYRNERPLVQTKVRCITHRSRTGFELSLVKPLMLLWALFSCGWVQGMSREQHFASAWKRWENISWGRFRLSIKI